MCVFSSFAGLGQFIFVVCILYVTANRNKMYYPTQRMIWGYLKREKQIHSRNYRYDQGCYEKKKNSLHRHFAYQIQGFQGHLHQGYAQMFFYLKICDFCTQGFQRHSANAIYVTISVTFLWLPIKYNKNLFILDKSRFQGLAKYCCMHLSPSGERF